MQGACVQKIEIGARLKEERERLGMSQVQFAGLGEVSKRAQITYENGESTPNAAYLAVIAKIGADVQYIITGVCSSAALTTDEDELVRLFRAAPIEVKATIVAGLKGGTSARPASKFSVQGDVGQQFDSPSGGSFTVDMRKERKKKE